ncbi:MAG: hypothetical protein B7X10_01260 [Burkholderiales bacterium 21-58-4]|nr:MAG: hypothetical protein B7X10_01260 [Burkholderiales bacterium 21-58-4]
MLGVANLYNVPIQIQGFATDDAFTAADVDTAETMMGVDGKLSAGFTPYPTTIEISLQADSASNLFFDAIINAELVAREKYVMNGSILIPSLGQLFSMTTGFLGKVTKVSAAKKVMQPRKFEIVFQSVVGAPV